MNFKLLLLSLVVSVLAACGNQKTDTSNGTNLTGSVNIDGSSTVYPITEAVAEEFQKIQPGVKVSVALSGTGPLTANERDLTSQHTLATNKPRDLLIPGGITVRFHSAVEVMGIEPTASTLRTSRSAN